MTALILGLQLVANDDRDVIQAALLGFFRQEDWYAADWKPKNQVVLGTQFRSKERPIFEKLVETARLELEENLAYAERRMKSGQLKPGEEARLAKYLQEARQKLTILKSVAGAAGSYQPPELRPLKSMVWDARIRLSDRTSRTWAHMDPDPTLEKWTVYFSVSRPAYSGDGRFAFLRSRVPWSIHSVDIDFLFERTDEAWVRRVVISRFYV